MSVAQRLRYEITTWGSISAFSREIRKRRPHLRGTSRNMIQKYLDTDVPNLPKRQWFAAAAEILGVMPAWLETGRGFRTWVEHRASVVPDEAMEWPDRGRIVASMELRMRIQAALNNLPRLPYQAETPLMDFLHFLYVRKGPRALGGSFKGRWFPALMDDMGEDVGVTVDRIESYIKANFGPVLTDGGREWETVALTFTLLGSRYLREFAT